MLDLIFFFNWGGGGIAINCCFAARFNDLAVLLLCKQPVAQLDGDSISFFFLQSSFVITIVGERWRYSRLLLICPRESQRGDCPMDVNIKVPCTENPELSKVFLFEA